MSTTVRHRYDSLTRELYIHHYNVTALPPDIIPADTKIIKCNANALAELPDALPKRLHTLNCVDNKLTHIKSSTLPRKLYEFNCSNNNITRIDPDLPPNLKHFDCSNNNLIQLPELPKNLMVFYCYNNKLTILPDLPQTLLYYINVYDTTLDTNYPKLKHLQDVVDNVHSYDSGIWRQASAIATLVIYVNARNVVIRQQERSRIINANNCLLETYMRKMMHPSRLSALVDNDDLDVDEFMTAYVETL